MGEDEKRFVQCVDNNFFSHDGVCYDNSHTQIELPANVAERLVRKGYARYVSADKSASPEPVLPKVFGTGDKTFEIVVRSKTGLLAGAEVWVTSDGQGEKMVARGETGGDGKAVFRLDAGEFFVWKRVPGFEFKNPEKIIVQ